VSAIDCSWKKTINVLSSYSLLTIFFFCRSSLQDAEQNPVNATEHTDHASSKPDNKKVQIGRVPTTTTSQDLPKWNASRPDKHDASPLLAGYASAKTSKTDVSIPPVSNQNKYKTKPSHHR
jgi:hypothetical protein